MVDVHWRIPEEFVERGYKDTPGGQALFEWLRSYRVEPDDVVNDGAMEVVEYPEEGLVLHYNTFVREEDGTIKGDGNGPWIQHRAVDVIDLPPIDFSQASPAGTSEDGANDGTE